MLAKTLYQCPDLIDTEDGEVTDEQLQEIVQRHTETIEKVKALCGFIRYLEHGIAACKQERDRIAGGDRSSGRPGAVPTAAGAATLRPIT